ncbi:N-acetyltransferase (plasmid) [Fulvitalea axinellae]|uniref:N-acetyltransferase n=1 Tax=Fulvitalea axinellae TaxID=1182444 RepID=A0AAU9D356_9BACT|nr:N-acetyltransferase [Fulvitalea axinellae]
MVNEYYFDNFPELESERLIFRRFSIDDAPDVFEIRSDDRVMRFMDSHKHRNVYDSEGFISKNFEIYKKGNGLFWAIVEKASGELVGDFAFWRIEKENRRAEIGYSMKPKFWGKGFMTEAMDRLLRFGFTDLNLHSVEAEINPENENSEKVLLRMGFKREAYFRENRFFDGWFLDSAIYSLLERDFKYDMSNLVASVNSKK